MSTRPLLEGEIHDILLKTLPTGLYAIDSELNIIYWNDRMEKISGMRKNEVLGKNIATIPFMKNAHDDTDFDHMQCILDPHNVQYSVFLRHREQGLKLVLIEKRSIEPDSNSPIWAVFIVSDISHIISCSQISDRKIEAERSQFHNIIGKDEKMQEIYKMIGLAAESLTNVLITGESGTGKDLIAKAIHDLSPRKNKPFITVNCAALSESLLESELFGHVKGSFTGAYRDKVGKFEAAHGGTIFLDEIGDISPLIQVKLLRVIQDKTITRVGDNGEITVDMRIITATNRNLRELTSSGRFREDLYYRLKVFTIHTIALRDRKTDIPLLCAHFIREFNKKTHKTIRGFMKDAYRLILDYCWPGNVRDLENAIEYAFVVCTSDLIDVFDLPQELRMVELRKGICDDANGTPAHEGASHRDARVLQEAHSIKPRNTVTKDGLITLLKSNNWNKSETARQLGISRVALWKKIKKFEIEHGKEH